MIATTIKRIHLDQIKAGDKHIDYRAYNAFWQRKIEGKLHRAILFLCGRTVEVYAIEKIEVVPTPEDLREIIPDPQSYAIHLGGAHSLAEASENVQEESQE